MTTPPAPTTERALVIIPTYNELENLPLILARLFDAVPDAHALIVDDNSPDGTGALADRIAETDERVAVQHRTGKLGLGSAYVLGFTWGLEHGYDQLIEMDADGSHPPTVLPAMIKAAGRGAAGLAIGARWVKGGSVINWSVHREILSRGANLYARLILGISVRDATAGFRVYRAEVIRALDPLIIESKGYCFQIDMTLRTLDAGFDVVELPIEFRERELGESKMSGSIIVEAMKNVTKWGIQRRFAQLVGLLRPGRG